MERFIIEILPEGSEYGPRLEEALATDDASRCYVYKGKIMSSSITGRCHCGLVQWIAELPKKVILNCHCNLCRQLSGADYSSWVIFPEKQVEICQGSEDISHYQATDNYSISFCSKCGSTVNAVNEEKFPNDIYLARGNITSDFDMPADLQVYTVDKASWLEINDAIPVFNP